MPAKIDSRPTGGTSIVGSGTGGQVAVFSSGGALTSFANLTNNGTLVSVVGASSKFRLPDGTAASPALAYTSDTTNGLYKEATSVFGIAANGNKVATFSGLSSGEHELFSDDTLGTFRQILSIGFKAGITGGGTPIPTIMMNRSSLSMFTQINQNAPAQGLILSGSSSSFGSQIILYGNSHATKPNVTEFYSSAATLNATIGATGNLSLNVVGSGYRVAEGSNAKMGTATMVGGTVVVSNTSVTANSRIFLTIQSPGGTLGSVYVSARTAATSFTITSTSVVDTSVVAYLIIEPS